MLFEENIAQINLLKVHWNKFYPKRMKSGNKVIDMMFCSFTRICNEGPAVSFMGRQMYHQSLLQHGCLCLSHQILPLQRAFLHCRAHLRY